MRLPTARLAALELALARLETRAARRTPPDQVPLPDIDLDALPADLRARILAHGGLWVGGSREAFITGCRLLYEVGRALQARR
jgi:hypothetical protein